MNEIQIIYGKESRIDHNNYYFRKEDFEFPRGEEDYRIAISELSKIQNSLLLGKKIPELFMYDNVSLWWFIYQSIVPNYKKITNFIYKFFQTIDDLKPKKITIIDDFEKFEIIKQICNLKKIPFSYSKKSYLQFKLLTKTKNSLKSKRYSTINENKIKSRKNLFFEKKKLIPDITNKILFAIPTIYRRQIFDAKNNSMIEGEYIQQSLIDLLDNSVIGMDLDYTFKGNTEILEHRLNDPLSWFPVEVLLDQSNTENQKAYLENYKLIINKKSFQDLFSFMGINFWQQIAPIFFEMIFSPHIPFYLLLIDSLSNYFKKNSPQAVFLPYETGPLGLALIHVCKKLGILSIGIQHAYIYPNSPMYSFGKEISKESYSFPLPDFTLLFGNYVKDLLIKNGYPSEKLKVIGNPAFFELEKVIKLFNEESIFKKFQIQSNKKIILFTSGKFQKFYSSNGTYDYDEQIWKYLLEHFGNNDEYFLVLKPHPQESNVLVYQNLLSELNIKNAKIIHDNLFELIFISSIVLSVSSSTIFDSLIFKKPVIRIKFQNEKHSILDNSKAIISLNLNELKDKIQDLNNSSDQQSLMLKEIELFIMEHYGIPSNEPKKALMKILNNKNNKFNSQSNQNTP